MANVLNRETKQFIRSVNTPNYPVSVWIIDPDLKLVDGFPSFYWTITGDIVSLMSQAERDAIDAQRLSDQKDQEAGRMVVSGFDKAFALAVLSEINILRVKLGLKERTATQLKDAVRSRI